MADQELILRLKAAGAAEAVAALEGVAGAEQRVVDAVKKVQLESEDARPAAEALAEAQGRLADLQERLAKAHSGGTVGDVRLLNAAIREQEAVVGELSPRVRTANVSFEAMSRILGQIDPELAGFAMDARGATQLLGGLTAGSISAGVGFSALLASIHLAAQRIRDLREQLKAIKDEATRREEETLARSNAISLAARKRPEGGFTAEEDAAAHMALTAMQERVRDAELLQHNIAALQGVISAQGIFALTQAGVEIPIDKTTAVRKQLAERELSKPETAERAERESDLVRDRKRRMEEEAAKEAKSRDILEGEAAIRSMAREVFPGLDKEGLDTAVEMVRKRLAISDATERAGVAPLSEEDMQRVVGEQLHPWLASMGRALFLGMGQAPRSFVVDADSEVVREVARRTADRIEANAPRTVNNFQGSRFYGPDTASRRKRIVNGDTAARDAERIGG